MIASLKLLGKLQSKSFVELITLRDELCKSSFNKDVVKDGQVQVLIKEINNVLLSKKLELLSEIF